MDLSKVTALDTALPTCLDLICLNKEQQNIWQRAVKINQHSSSCAFLPVYVRIQKVKNIIKENSFPTGFYHIKDKWKWNNEKEVN